MFSFVVYFFSFFLAMGYYLLVIVLTNELTSLSIVNCLYLEYFFFLVVIWVGLIFFLMG